MPGHCRDGERWGRSVTVFHRDEITDSELRKAGKHRRSIDGVQMAHHHRRSHLARPAAAGEPAHSGDIGRYAEGSVGGQPDDLDVGGNADRLDEDPARFDGFGRPGSRDFGGCPGFHEPGVAPPVPR